MAICKIPLFVRNPDEWWRDSMAYKHCCQLVYCCCTLHTSIQLCLTANVNCTHVGLALVSLKDLVTVAQEKSTNRYSSFGLEYSFHGAGGPQTKQQN